MSDFKFPTNIKQIGSISDGINIYMEDYVSSYLNQYAELAGYEERLAILLGKRVIVDEREVLFISGALQGKFCETKNGIMTFTDEAWKYADEQIELFFPNLEIIGWMQSQPSYGVFLNSSYLNYHIKNFKNPYQVLFINDPIEKINAFYVYNEEMTELKETGGYFVYYEKNKRMHEYMVENRLVKNNPKPTKSQTIKLSMPTNNQAENSTDKIEKIRKTNMKESKPWIIPAEPDIVDESIRHKKVQLKMDKTIIQQKRLVNMLVGLSAVLFVIAFIMGAGLMQNEDRITMLEKDITSLNSTYKSVLANAKETPVFANTDDKNENIVPIEKSEAIDNNTKPKAELTTEDGNVLLAEKVLPENELVKQQNNSTTNEIINPVLDIIKENTAKAETEKIETQKETPKPETKKIETEDSISISASTSTNKKINDIPETYTVQKGDSLIYISTKFYGDRSMTKAIMELNKLDNPNKIIFGKVLQLPQLKEDPKVE